MYVLLSTNQLRSIYAAMVDKRVVFLSNLIDPFTHVDRSVQGGGGDRTGTRGYFLAYARVKGCA